MATYMWKKYSVKITTTTVYTDNASGSGSYSFADDRTKVMWFGKGYSFNTKTGKYTLTNTKDMIVYYALRTYDEIDYAPYKYMVSLTDSNAKSGSTLYELTAAVNTDPRELSYNTRTATSKSSQTESQGTYIEDVTSTKSSAYPTNGKHTDGYWYVKTNVAPTTPGVPSLPAEIKGGDSVTVSWTASTDPEGGLSGYQLAVSLDGGSWTQVYQGSSRSYNYTVPEGSETIAFRVRAYDSSSAYSSYATSATVEVSNGGINGYVNINGSFKTLTGEGYVNIGGVQKTIVNTYVNISGVWKESF